MAYIKTYFEDGDTLTATHMNNIEDGIISVEQSLKQKQDSLADGRNIKTVNGESLLGPGNIEIKAKEIVVDTTLSTSSENPVQNKAITSALNNKQDTLSEADFKTINGESVFGEGNIIIDGSGSGTTITIDDALSSTSTNPLQNKVITTALTNKQDTLISGASIKTINGQSLLGSGDITITGNGSSIDLSNYITKNVFDELVARVKVLEDENTLIVNPESGNGEQTTVTLTISATPSDAIVKINGTQQKSITVVKGTTVTYEVSKSGYVTQSGSKTVNSTETITVNLIEESSGDAGGDTGGGNTGDEVVIANESDFTNGGWYRPNGTLETANGYAVTDYIDVSTYSSVSLIATLKTYSLAPVVWFDESKTFISGQSTTGSGVDTSVVTTNTFAVPDGAKYARFSCYYDPNNMDATAVLK